MNSTLMPSFSACSVRAARVEADCATPMTLPSRSFQDWMPLSASTRKPTWSVKYGSEKFQLFLRSSVIVNVAITRSISPLSSAGPRVLAFTPVNCTLLSSPKISLAMRLARSISRPSCTFLAGSK